MTATTLRSWDTLPDIDVLSAEYLRDPHAVYRRYRHTWAARSSRGVELLSYDVSNRVLRDGRFRQPALHFLEQIGITDGLFHRMWANIMQHSDGERHARLRRHVMHHFNARAVAALRPVVHEILGDALSRLNSDGHCEFVTDIAERIPSALFCRLIGSPPQDAPLITSLSDRLLVVFAMDAKHGPDMEAAAHELHEYVITCLAERRRHPGNDWISDLLRAQASDPMLTDDDIYYLVAESLIASTDNTSQQLSLAMFLFAQDPRQWELLRSDPELSRTAIEEVMRFSPRLLSVMRIADEDVDLDGLHVPAGALMSVLVAAAGRDPAVYEDPDRFDIRRPPKPGTLNFGAGPHMCSGAGLARMEMQEALTMLVGAWRTVSLSGEVVRTNEPDAQALTRLPLAFDPSPMNGSSLEPATTAAHSDTATHHPAKS